MAREMQFSPLDFQLGIILGHPMFSCLADTNQWKIFGEPLCVKPPTMHKMAHGLAG